MEYERRSATHKTEAVVNALAYTHVNALAYTQYQEREECGEWGAAHKTGGSGMLVLGLRTKAGADKEYAGWGTAHKENRRAGVAGVQGTKRRTAKCQCL